MLEKCDVLEIKKIKIKKSIETMLLDVAEAYWGHVGEGVTSLGGCQESPALKISVEQREQRRGRPLLCGRC